MAIRAWIKSYLPILSIGLAASSAGVLAWQMLALTPYQDFPWLLSRKFGLGESPFSEYLLDTNAGPERAAEIPNMLHGTYVLLAPLGLMDFTNALVVYLLISLTLLAGIIMLVYKESGQQKWVFWAALGLFLGSSPVRVALYNGQFSVIALFLIMWFFLQPTKLKGLAAGLAFLKYSFALPFFFSAFRRKASYRGILLGAVLPILGLLVMALVLGIRDIREFVQLTFAPLSAALVGTGIGASDIPSLTRSLGYDSALVAVLLVSVAVSLFVALRGSQDSLVYFSQLSLVSLAFFPHLLYDYVFLLGPVLVALLRWNKVVSLMVMPTVVWHWYALPLLENVFLPQFVASPAFIFLGLLLNLLAFLGLLRSDARETSSGGLQQW